MRTGNDFTSSSESKNLGANREPAWADGVFGCDP
jgi:hypothetical protein